MIQGEFGFQYIETHIPVGMTIDEYRRSRPQKSRRLLARLLAALR